MELAKSSPSPGFVCQFLLFLSYNSLIVFYSPVTLPLHSGRDLFLSSS